jgi:hypothetical protein
MPHVVDDTPAQTLAMSSRSKSNSHGMPLPDGRWRCLAVHSVVSDPTTPALDASVAAHMRRWIEGEAANHGMR